MAIPYTQDWSAGNSTFTSISVYNRPTDGPDALYPEVRHQTDCTVNGSSKLDWDGVNDDYSAAGLWLQSMGSLNGGGSGAYAVTGFWDGSVGYIECTYTPNATSLGVANYSPLMAPLSAAGFSLMSLSYDHSVPEYVIDRNTEAGYASNSFAGVAPAAGVPLTIRLAWKCGTYNVGPDDHDADGYLRVYLNGSLEYEETNISLYLSFLTNPRDLIDSVSFGFVGLLGELDDITITDVESVVSATPQIGSCAFGSGVSIDPDVSYAVAFGMDGGTHVHSESGKVKFYGNLSATGYFELTDGIAEPDTASGAAAGMARLFIDIADGDLKIKFSDGTLKTIVVDT